MTNLRFTRRTALAALLGLGLVACSPERDGDTGKQIDGGLRHELEPLTERIPVLTDAEAAIWVSGTLGDDRAPGPSSYWIDALVDLDEATCAALAGLKALPATLPTDIHEEILPHVPQIVFSTSSELDAFFSHEGWQTHAFVAMGEPRVLLLIQGQ